MSPKEMPKEMPKEIQSDEKLHSIKSKKR
jgi:hypothetical protein